MAAARVARPGGRLGDGRGACAKCATERGADQWHQYRGTSFLDGFTSTTPGLAVVTYLRHNALDAIKDARGNDIRVFDNPRIDSTVLLTQFAYVTPYRLFGGSLGITALVPLVNLDASFGRNSIATLRDNGAGVGDVTFGPYLQMPPVIRNGRAVFSQRFEFDAVAPIGK